MQRWYCIQARPQKAFYAKANIDRLGFSTLLPSESITKPYHGIMREQLVPLFGSYFFVAFDVDIDNWKPITSSPGVRRLLSHTPEQPTFIPDVSMQSMLQCMIPDTKPVPQSIIQPGARVHIIKGPLARDDIPGYEPYGICQWKRGNRIALLIAMIRGDVEVTFNSDSLELAH